MILKASDTEPFLEGYVLGLSNGGDAKHEPHPPIIIPKDESSYSDTAPEGGPYWDSISVTVERDEHEHDSLTVEANGVYTHEEPGAWNVVIVDVPSDMPSPDCPNCYQKGIEDAVKAMDDPSTPIPDLPPSSVIPLINGLHGGLAKNETEGYTYKGYELSVDYSGRNLKVKLTDKYGTSLGGVSASSADNYYGIKVIDGIPYVSYGVVVWEPAVKDYVEHVYDKKLCSETVWQRFMGGTNYSYTKEAS